MQRGGTEIGRKVEREEKGVRREGVIMNTRSGYATVPGGGYLSGEADECAPCTRVRGWLRAYLLNNIEDPCVIVIAQPGGELAAAAEGIGKGVCTKGSG